MLEDENEIIITRFFFLKTFIYGVENSFAAAYIVMGLGSPDFYLPAAVHNRRKKERKKNDSILEENNVIGLASAGKKNRMRKRCWY